LPVEADAFATYAESKKGPPPLPIRTTPPPIPMPSLEPVEISEETPAPVRGVSK
jgi:hypothetical protein